MRFPILSVVLLLGSLGSALAADPVPAAAYFPVLPLDAPSDATPQLVAMAVNRPLEGPHVGVERAVIVIHDESRDANAALALVSALAGNENTRTMIFAPQFMLSSDIARFAGHLPEAGRAFASWQVPGWMWGDNSVSVPGRKSISSFTVVDLLLMVLCDRESFPDLRTIVIAGHGGGANFVQRYAALSLAAEQVEDQYIDLRFLIAAPSSYMYMTANRPLVGHKGFGPPNAASCPGYNDYPYGLNKLNPYGRRSGANAAKMNYVTRRITYVSPRAEALFPDTACGAMAQGMEASSRSSNFQRYMQSTFGDAASRTQNFVSTLETRNDAFILFSSPCGMATLFGDGFCAGGFE